MNRNELNLFNFDDLKITETSKTPNVQENEIDFEKELNNVLSSNGITLDTSNIEETPFENDNNFNEIMDIFQNLKNSSKDLGLELNSLLKTEVNKNYNEKSGGEDFQKLESTIQSSNENFEENNNSYINLDNENKSMIRNELEKYDQENSLFLQDRKKQAFDEDSSFLLPSPVSTQHAKDVDLFDGLKLNDNIGENEEKENEQPKQGNKSPNKIDSKSPTELLQQQQEEEDYLNTKFNLNFEIEQRKEQKEEKKLKFEFCTKWCSWCWETTDHEKLENNWLARNKHSCISCKHETVPCVGCNTAMCRSYGNDGSDKLCFKCDGTYSKLSRDPNGLIKSGK